MLNYLAGKTHFLNRPFGCMGAYAMHTKLYGTSRMVQLHLLWLKSSLALGNHVASIGTIFEATSTTDFNKMPSAKTILL
jgi:hypothetical protein